jgi:hypothetical protein
VPGATYYHVQVFRGGRRVHVAWPVGRSLRLPPAVLRPGATYVWYVWPGLERKVDARYGRLIGKATFRLG